MKSRLQSNNLRHYRRKYIWNVLTSLTMVISHITNYLQTFLGGIPWSNLGSQTGSTRTSLVVKVFRTFCYVIHWSHRSIFQPLPASQNSAQWSSRSLILQKTSQPLYPIHIQSLFRRLNPIARYLKSNTKHLSLTTIFSSRVAEKLLLLQCST